MSEKIGSIQIWIGIIDKTQEAIQAQQEAATKEIREIFWALANSVKSFSEEGNLDEVSNLLKELESAKEKIKWELQKLQKTIQSEAGQAGKELQNLATNLKEKQDDTTEKENFETKTDKANKEKALNFIQTKITNPNTFESIKKKINEIKYTQSGIIIGPVQWKKFNYWDDHQIASKTDFEKSFEWLFGEKLPIAKQSELGAREYPRDPRIAVIPFLLGWEKKGRYGQDGKWHNVWESGFYALKDGRVCKFDETGGTIRSKRDADRKIEIAYII